MLCNVATALQHNETLILYSYLLKAISMNALEEYSWAIPWALLLTGVIGLRSAYHAFQDAYYIRGVFSKCFSFVCGLGIALVGLGIIAVAIVFFKWGDVTTLGATSSPPQGY